MFKPFKYIIIQTKTNSYMIHECNIHCRTVDADSSDLLGILSTPDNGHWMPFAFLLEIVIACKMASNDNEDISYKATTIFTDGGDAYIIDTPYKKFKALWTAYMLDEDNIENKGNNSDDIIF